MVGKKIRVKKEVKETVKEAETLVEPKKEYKFNIWEFLGIKKSE